jgi:membrane protein DedA with SNARE-associated domain/rhodanese-related sulfurtransferase
MEHQLALLSGGLGVVLVISNVLLDQIGLPVPALPTLIVAGAVMSSSASTMTQLFLGATAACVIPDIGWYCAGRVYGGRVMKFLCRMSLSPDSCVSRTQVHFERWGAGALVVAKFVPGLALVAPPLAGATGMHWPRFLLCSALGAAIWVGTALATGVLLKAQIAALLPYLRQLGSTAVAVVALLLAAYIAFKWRERRGFIAALRMARISVDELYKLMAAGAAPVIVDVRSATARALEPRRLPGALMISLQEVAQQLGQLSRDREIVLYCTCPNEVSAARVAKILMSHGFKRVRPLHGGLDAWLAAGYAAEALPAATAKIGEHVCAPGD